MVHGAEAVALRATAEQDTVTGQAEETVRVTIEMNLKVAVGVYF